MAVFRRSDGGFKAVIRQCNGGVMAVGWRFDGGFMAVIRQCVGGLAIFRRIDGVVEAV